MSCERSKLCLIETQLERKNKFDVKALSAGPEASAPVSRA